MAKLKQSVSQTPQSVMLFGAPFSGKSTLAAQLAEHFNLIWVDMEKGSSILYKLPKEWQDRVELIALPDTQSYPIAAETVLKMVKGKPVSICDMHGKVACALCKRASEPSTDVDLGTLGLDTVVVFDSLTQLSNSVIAHITKNQPDEYKLEYDDWGNLGKLLNIFLSHIQQANYHCIVISHEMEIETEGKKKKLSPVGGTKNFARSTPKFFDHVVYMEIKNKSHKCASSTSFDTRVVTGSRTDVALEDSQESSLLQIFKPELFPASAQSDKPALKPALKPKGGGAANILNKLKK